MMVNANQQPWFGSDMRFGIYICRFFLELGVLWARWNFLFVFLLAGDVNIVLARENGAIESHYF
jgi:hypothetical protein